MPEKIQSGRSLRWEQMKPLIFVYSFLIVMMIAAELTSPGFLQLSHLENILRQASFLGIVAIGQNLVLLIGGMDMSVGYIITFSNILAASVIAGKNENTLIATILVLLVGAAAGLLNGLGVFFLKIPPMVMTLGMGNVIYGLSYIYSGGAPKGKTSEIIDNLANGKLGGIINGSLLIWLILAAVTIWVLRQTTFGRKVYAIGINSTAAYYSGVHVGKITVLLYTISGLLSALAGLLLLGYTGTSYFSTGDPYTLDSVAAAVVGGTAVVGGKGSYVGTMAGVVIMIVLTSLMTMLNMPESGRKMVQGLIIIVLLLVIYSDRKNKE